MSFVLVLIVACGGDGTICESKSTQACKCGSQDGTQTCNVEGSGYDACNCDNTDTEKTSTKEKASVEENTDTEEKNTSEETTNGPEPGPEAGPEAGPEPGPEPEPESNSEAGPEPGPETTPEPGPEKVTCSADEFDYNNTCIKIADFCEGKITDPNVVLPKFTAEDTKAMAQPYKIVVDPITNKPKFCETKTGYFFLNSFGYGQCDNDGDGWVNIFAYRAHTSTNKQIQTNARCTVSKVKVIVYKQDGRQWLETTKTTTFEQTLKSEAVLVETDKNDGLGKLIEMPVYTVNQSALPRQKGVACAKDSECNGGKGEVCYNGNCIVGRRFQANEINTATKGCIAGLDLNDNQIGDANERPTDSPNPKAEFTPILPLGYFMELQYGYLQKGHKTKDGKTQDVWMIAERTRDSKVTDIKKLQLKCQEETNAFQPDHWRNCGLRDDQQCDDPNNPGQLKAGLSQCWMKDVQQATPSLFKCVVFDSSFNSSTKSGFFHPSNYGFSKNYSRSKCKVKASKKGAGGQQDIEFDCSADTGNTKPDPSKQEVGWACISYKSYTDKAKHLAGCISEYTHQVCGDPNKSSNKSDKLTYLLEEANSYGLVRAKKECGTKYTKGVCKSAEHVCTGGTWTTCNKCDTCPQVTAGQKKICPNGIWPSSKTQQGQVIDTCKKVLGPSTEKCNGLDDDCDGFIDEGLMTQNWYMDADKDSYGAGSVIKVCEKDANTICKCDVGSGNTCTQATCVSKIGYAPRSGDCNDNDKNIKPSATELCDGIDNNCDGNIDNPTQKFNWYVDSDNDGYGEKGKFRKFYGCKQGSDKFCYCTKTVKGLCTQVSCIPRKGYATNNSDCCDKDPNTKPGQTNYYPQKNACNDFDYNCDGKSTKKEPTCQCTTSIKYDTWISMLVYIDTGGNSWFYRKGSETFTNQGSCKLAKTFTYGPQNDYKVSYQCTWGSSSCEVANSIPATLVTHSWTPSPPGGGKYIMWSKNNHNANCYYKLDGTLPGCGEVGYKAGNSITDNTAYEVKYSKQNIGAGTLKCSSCSGGRSTTTVPYNAAIGRFEITINQSQYTLTKESITTLPISCR